MKNNNNRKNIVPQVSYFNLDTNKSIIYKENRGKSGIYRINNINRDKSYIGSSINLSRRFSSYYSIKSLKRKSKNSRINRALLKYGYENFNLDILEYCNKENVISREQYYFDLLKPEYNILQVAGSSLGFKYSTRSKLIMSDLKKGKKHTQQTKDKISLALKGRVHSEETRAKISLSMLNKTPNMETRNKMKISHSKPILITNIINNKTYLYPSIKEAALKLNTSSTTIRRHIKKKRVLCLIYIL